MSNIIKQVNKFFKKSSDLEKLLKKQNQEKDSKILKKEGLNEKIFKAIKVIKYKITNVLSTEKFNYEELQEEIEEILIQFDFGASLSGKLSTDIVAEIKYSSPKNLTDIQNIFVQELTKFYGPNISDELLKNDKKTNIWLVCGANGTGKTTTISKIAYLFKKQGKKILLIAADTFRAGAVQQLKEWAQKIEIDILEPAKEKEDPAALIYKGLQNNVDYELIICDTSGRQHNQKNLMQEMEKIYRIIKKFDEHAPHRSFLILDSTQGQTSFVQSESFLNSAQITEIILTKMDSASRGGFIFAIKSKYNIPVRYICVGEDIEDILDFDVQLIAQKIANLIDVKN